MRTSTYMSTLRSLFAVPVSVLVVLAAQACTAEGGAGDAPEDTSNAPDATSTLPPQGQAPEGGPTPPKSDSGGGGGGDAAVDAGPPPPAPGSPCPTANVIFKKQCGACGTQEAVCLAGGDAGGGTVSDYGPCGNEVAGGCIPGTTENAACGNCGSRVRTCNQYCLWNQTACAGEKTGATACHKGSTNLSNAGCAVPGTYREQTCSSTCTWGNFDACTTPPNTGTLEVSDIQDGVVSGLYYMSAAQQGKRMTGTCVTSTPTLSTTTDHPYLWVVINNNTGKTATVTVYNSGPAGAPQINTYMAAYDTTVDPTDDASMQACKVGVGSSCTTALCGYSSYASLTTTRALVIPPGGSMGVKAMSYYAVSYTPVKPTEGLMYVNLRTDKLE